MFHAATAVLLSRGIERRSHHAVLSAFGEHIVKPGLVEHGWRIAKSGSETIVGLKSAMNVIPRCGLSEVLPVVQTNFGSL
jgi:hypothetical protein